MSALANNFSFIFLDNKPQTNPFSHPSTILRQRKTIFCEIEEEGDGTVITHSGLDKGYGIGSITMTKGNLYEWEVVVLFEIAGNEGSCLGVCNWPIKDPNYRNSKDMYLYRAYSGEIL